MENDNEDLVNSIKYIKETLFKFHEAINLMRCNQAHTDSRLAVIDSQVRELGAICYNYQGIDIATLDKVL